MPESTDLTTAIAVEVAKQIPVKEAYNDAVSPGAKQAGLIVQDIAKTLHLALAPLQLTAALQDRYREFLDRAIRRVPKQRRIAPAPQILGPVIEGIKYEDDETPICEMFSQLLSRSMDRDRVNEAHPAFPILIGQLSPDEAFILRQITEARRRGKTYKKQFRHTFRNGMSNVEAVELDDFPADQLHFPSNIDFYMNHLWSLGLAGIFEWKPQEPTYNGGKQTGSREFREYRLTDLGRLLASAALE
ncbi:DUF4393 domain-containing protein [Ensifer sp. D2-11]